MMLYKFESEKEKNTVTCKAMWAISVVLILPVAGITITDIVILNIGPLQFRYQYSSIL